MKLSIINCPVSDGAKRIFLDYQRENQIGTQGTALDRMLKEFKNLKKEIKQLKKEVIDNVQSK